MTPEEPAAAPRESVTLIEEEIVMAGGAATVKWFVGHNDGWVRAQSYPGARVERLDRGPKIVWRTRVTLELVRGTPLTRVEMRPDTRRRTALEHLTSSARGMCQKKLTDRFAVGARHLFQT